MVDGRQNTGDNGLKIKTFQDLEVWKISHRFVLDIYKISTTFPRDELYGLTSQIRRAAVSIPANITEGFSRRSNPDKRHFYNMAQASLHEIKYYLILAQDLGYVDSNFVLWHKSEQIGKMLYRFIESTKRSAP